MAQSIFPAASSGIPTGVTNARPTSPATGDVFYDGTVGFLMIWDGTAWIATSAPASQPTISVADIGTSVAYGAAQANVTFTEGTSGGKKAGFTVSSSTGGYTATSTSLSVFPITVGTNGNWSFTGTAYNGFGTSPVSSSVTQTLTTVPQAPTIGAVSMSGVTTDVIVDWTLNSTGGQALTAITVTPYLNGVTAGSTQNASTTSSTSMTFTGLTRGSSYTFKVKTTNANGTGLESSASSSLTIPTVVTVEYLVIAGGGGGANRSYRAGGGGGAGGYKTSTLSAVRNTNFTATVGAGGGHATAGNNSVFSSVTSTAGGYGAYGGGGGNGGSGGGGCGAGAADNGGSPNLGGTASPSGQGNAGGNGINAAGSGGGAGGGGGAGAAGASSSGQSGGSGGSGSASSITGTSVTRAGGGGGSRRNSGSNGGGGDGGGGGSNVTGSANTGSGGGGSQNEGDNGSGYGGSGIVILRYLTSEGTITLGAGLTGSTATDGSYKVTTITAGTGNVSWA